MAGFGLLDNLVRAGSDLHVLSGTRFESGLADAVSDSNPQRAVEEWKRGVLEAHPSLRSTLDNVGMARIHSAVAGEKVYADFTDELVSGIDEARLASTADDYARRIVAEMSKTDGTLPTSGAEYDALLDVHRGRLLRGAEVFNENLTSRMEETNLSRDEVIARYFRPEGSDDAAETTARNAEADPVKPAGEDAAARTAASADDASSPSAISRVWRGISSIGSAPLTLRRAAMLAAAPVAAAAVNNKFDGAPLEFVVENLLGREALEKYFEVTEIANAELAQSLATLVGGELEERGLLDRSDEVSMRAVLTASHYAIGDWSGAGVVGGDLIDPSAALDIHGRTTAEMRAENPDVTREEIAQEVFLRIRDRMEQENQLAALVDTDAPDTAGTAAQPDTHQQGGSQAGTPAAVLAEQRRRAEDGLTATGDESTASVLRQQTQGIFNGGLSLDTFSVAALTGSSLTAAFDAVAKDSWLLKIGNTIAGWMGEGVQSFYQSAVLKSHDKEEVYMALREAASEGRLVSNDPGNDRFGVMSLLDFAPNAEPEVS